MKKQDESSALAEEWLDRLRYKSVLSKKALGPNTIDRYRQVVFGSPTPRAVQPKRPFLTWWAETAPGEGVWLISREQFVEFLNLPVRDGHGGVTEPSSSERNSRRSAVLNMLTWMALRKQLPVDEDVLEYEDSYESKGVARRKDMTMHPLRDGVFSAIWLGLGNWHDQLLWIGMAAFMTMRKAEIANMRPWVPGDGQSLGVDLERRTATFLGKGGKPRTVHYGALAEFDWPMLPHLRDFPERFVKLFEEHVEQRQDDVRRGMELRWLHPWTEGASRPDRDNPKLDVWFASKADLKRFDRRWQAALKQAGYAEREYTPHQLRHFAAMNMWRAGTSWERLKREMGHDQEATTHAYLNFRPEYDRERRRNEVARADEPQE